MKGGEEEVRYLEGYSGSEAKEQEAEKEKKDAEGGDEGVHT